MLKRTLTTLVLTMCTAGAAFAASYMEPQELKQALEQKKPVILVDIQPAADFKKQHLPGAIETNAFPAKNDEEKMRLDKTVDAIKKSDAPVVIICPRGGSGATNSYNYYLSKGIPENRLKILKGGNDKWPFPEMFVKGK